MIAKDPGRAQAYYSELFGWEIDAQPMEGVEIGLFKDPEGNIVGLTGRAG